MKFTLHKGLIIALLLLALLMVACESGGDDNPTNSPTTEASATPTATPSPTNSPTPTLSPTPTNSPTPTLSPTPTNSPTPTLAPNTLTENGYSDIAQVFFTTDEKVNKDAYVACSVRIVDNTGVFEEWETDKATIKIRGNMTASVNKKSYNIKLEEKAEILGMTKGNKWCFLANDYDKSRMRNEIALNLSRQLSGIEYTMQSTYVDVWLNGKYMGNFLMTTAVKASKNSVDIDEDNGDFLIEREKSRKEEGEVYFKTPWKIRFKVNEPGDITEEALATLTKMVAEAEEAMATHDLEIIKSKINVASFIDFYIVEEFMKNKDIDFSSTRYYFKQGILYAGPVWDFDLSSGNCNSEIEEYGPNVNNVDEIYALKTKWISELLKCPEIMTMMADRYAEIQPIIVNIYKDNELGKNQIDILLEKYGYSMQRDYSVAKWKTYPYLLEYHYPGKPNGVPFSESVEYLRSWLEKRNQALYEYFSPYMTNAGA